MIGHKQVSIGVAEKSLGRVKTRKGGVSVLEPNDTCPGIGGDDAGGTYLAYTHTITHNEKVTGSVAPYPTGIAKGSRRGLGPVPSHTVQAGTSVGGYYPARVDLAHSVCSLVRDKDIAPCIPPDAAGKYHGGGGGGAPIPRGSVGSITHDRFDYLRGRGDLTHPAVVLVSDVDSSDVGVNPHVSRLVQLSQ